MKKRDKRTNIERWYEGAESNDIDSVSELLNNAYHIINKNFIKEEEPINPFLVFVEEDTVKPFFINDNKTKAEMDKAINSLHEAMRKTVKDVEYIHFGLVVFPTTIKKGDKEKEVIRIGVIEEGVEEVEYIDVPYTIKKGERVFGTPFGVDLDVSRVDIEVKAERLFDAALDMIVQLFEKEDVEAEVGPVLTSEKDGEISLGILPPEVENQVEVLRQIAFKDLGKNKDKGIALLTYQSVSINQLSKAKVKVVRLEFLEAGEDTIGYVEIPYAVKNGKREIIGPPMSNLSNLKITVKGEHKKTFHME